MNEALTPLLDAAKAAYATLVALAAHRVAVAEEERAQAEKSRAAYWRAFNETEEVAKDYYSTFTMRASDRLIAAGSNRDSLLAWWTKRSDSASEAAQKAQDAVIAAVRAHDMWLEIRERWNEDAQ